jgi:hypothetical protein
VLFAGKHNPVNKEKKYITDLYAISDDVSPDKSFSKFWDEKGLRNWGINYLEFRGYRYEEQLDCLKTWFKILYNKSDDEFEQICTKLKTSIDDQRKQFYNEIPRGHITMVPETQILPNEIDRLYGNYDNYDQI